ncbi:hypothetical protein HDU93_009494 [Gonapodya sp. JEL0774]|nr:hypothetical protein HDU93_009494 [Gonapodya sp. JEL0774]
MTKPVILLFGATGKQGSAVLSCLQQNASVTHSLRIVTRDPSSAKARSIAASGVEVLKGDLLDATSLKDAMKGVWGVYLVTDNMGKGGVEGEGRQAKNAINEAILAGVQYFVYCSSSGATSVNEAAQTVTHFTSKRSIEQLIISTPWPFGYAILRPGSFFENLEVMGPLSLGSLSSITPASVRLKWISTADIGKFVALAFVKPELFKGKATEIVGDWISPNEMATVLTELTGAKWSYSQMPPLLLRLFSRDLWLMVTAMDKLDVVQTDIASLKQIQPELQSFRDWCVAKGIGKSGDGSYVYAKTLWQKVFG